jgi:integrase
MSLKIYERPKGSGNLHIRGTVQGLWYEGSARTRKRSEAEAIRAKIEAELYQRAIFGAKAVATFAEAAAMFMKAGGGREHMTGAILELGTMRLADINQATLDDWAQRREGLKPATVVRQIYAPVSAVINYAHTQGLCDPIRFRKPKLDNARTVFLTPQEAEAWLEALPDYLARIMIFYLATGCRASEGLNLQWRDVSPANERVQLYETKGGYPRSFDLPQRARAALGPRGHDEAYVLTNSHGEPWHGYDALNLMYKRTRERHPELRAISNHLLRHTWATWAYCCTRDLTYLQQAGGWRSLNLLGRYAHPASQGLAQDVLAYSWEFCGREIFKAGRKPRKALQNKTSPP